MRRSRYGPEYCDTCGFVLGAAEMRVLKAAHASAPVHQPQPVNRWELPQPAAPLVWNCPRCGEAIANRVCNYCGETHPCSCMDDDQDDGKTDADDF